MAVSRTVLGNFDVWLVDANRGIPARFTFEPTVEGMGVWSPDGNRLVFPSLRSGSGGLFERASSDAGDERVLLEGFATPLSWSSDGRFLLYTRTDPAGGADLWAIGLNDRKSIPVITTTADQSSGEFSPDGRWLMYESNESGRFEVYIQDFPELGGKWQISNAGGRQPRWRRDGTEVYYVASDGRLMAVPITTRVDARTLDFGAPIPLFVPRLASRANVVPGRPQYAVGPDGRSLLNTVVEDTAAAPITVVVNWMQTLSGR